MIVARSMRMIILVSVVYSKLIVNAFVIIL